MTTTRFSASNLIALLARVFLDAIRGLENSKALLNFLQIDDSGLTVKPIESAHDRDRLGSQVHRIAAIWGLLTNAVHQMTKEREAVPTDAQATVDGLTLVLTPHPNMPGRDWTFRLVQNAVGFFDAYRYGSLDDSELTHKLLEVVQAGIGDRRSGRVRELVDERPRTIVDWVDERENAFGNTAWRNLPHHRGVRIATWDIDADGSSPTHLTPSVVGTVAYKHRTAIIGRYLSVLDAVIARTPV
ncbi:MAG: hypothetical protein KDD44_05710, partial [Bdellovibrionales bacterium]|nr:hypothetical protein [Bdellovibrionales bacterium]